jgi:hypothetical protein
MTSDGQSGVVLVNFAHVTRALTRTTGEAWVPPDPSSDQARARMRTKVLDRAIAALQDSQTRPGVLSSPEDDSAGALLQSFLAEHAMHAGKVDEVASGVLEAKFDSGDWGGWAASFFTWVEGLRPHPWLPAPETPQTVPNELRVAVVGDWGTAFTAHRSARKHP